MKLVLQSIVLIISFVLIFVWQNSFLSDYTATLLAACIALYLILSARRGGKGFLALGGEGPLGIFLLNTVIFLLIFATGSISSPLFFLLYFLGFGIAFVFEPLVIFIFVIGAILVFVPDALIGDMTSNLLKLGSLAFISPLAFFFGREARKDDAQEKEIEAMKERSKDSADTISEDIEEIINNAKTTLKERDIEKLNEVLEESESLRQESKIDS
jgi:hypothetical protein